jgi:lipoyl(octanoyl) transferase
MGQIFCMAIAGTNQPFSQGNQIRMAHPAKATANTKTIARDTITATMLPGSHGVPVAWKISPGLTPYGVAVERMEKLAHDIHLGNAPETVWLVEHPPLYTGGTSARPADLLKPDRFEVHKSGRGGEYTYHGPGQRVAYVMLDLNKRRQDVRAYVAALENWVISTLTDFNVTGERREDRVGVWVRRPEKAALAPGIAREDKIAAIGIRLRKWVSYHGIAINVEPDLEHFDGIVPCGVSGHGVTSLVDLGLPVTMADLDLALKRNFVPIFGEVET